MLLSQAVAVLVDERLPGWSHAARPRRRSGCATSRIPSMLISSSPATAAGFSGAVFAGRIPNNLPQQVTSFIRREREPAEAKELIGKTRS